VIGASDNVDEITADLQFVNQVDKVLAEDTVHKSCTVLSSYVSIQYNAAHTVIENSLPSDQVTRSIEPKKQLLGEEQIHVKELAIDNKPILLAIEKEKNPLNSEPIAQTDEVNNILPLMTGVRCNVIKDTSDSNTTIGTLSSNESDQNDKLDADFTNGKLFTSLCEHPVGNINERTYYIAMGK
jgi:hypothetical protein